MHLNENEIKRLDGLMQEMRNSKLRIQAENDWKKEAINAFIEEIGKERISKKQVNTLFKLYMLHEDNKLVEEVGSQEELVGLIEKITNTEIF